MGVICVHLRNLRFFRGRVGGNSEFRIPNLRGRVGGRSRYNRAVTTVQTARLRTFIRSTLGCTCPDDVLESIRCSHTDLANRHEVRLSRIDVGGRLLVYVIKAGDDPRSAADALGAVVAAGTVERNRGGFNRLRVVVATTDRDAHGAALERSFEESAPLDDRVHLHVIEVGDLPFD